MPNVNVNSKVVVKKGGKSVALTTAKNPHSVTEKQLKEIVQRKLGTEHNGKTDDEKEAEAKANQEAEAKKKAEEEAAAKKEAEEAEAKKKAEEEAAKKAQQDGESQKNKS